MGMEPPMLSVGNEKKEQRSGGGGAERATQAGEVGGLGLPDTREEPAEQKGAVALDERGEEGEDAVYGQADEEGLPTAYPVSKGPPEERPDHHPEIYNQTCRKRRDSHISV